MSRALRVAAQFEPEFVRRCLGSKLPLDGVLGATVADREAQPNERRLAAELLTIGGVERAFDPIVEHFLDCDGATAWDLGLALPWSLRLDRDQQRRIAEILRHHPEEERRAAVAQLLGNVPGRFSFGLLVETVEKAPATGYVRGRAAEALLSHDRPGALPALMCCLADPDPAVRFWAVFALGGIARFRPSLHQRVVAALRPITSDAAQMPGYWSVGLEARATIEALDCEERRRGEEERATILAQADAAADTLGEVLRASNT